MILTDREITIALEFNQIKIDPKPVREAISSTSVDLTLGGEGRQWQASGGLPVRPGHPKFRYQEAVRNQIPVTISGYTLIPNLLLLAWTKEYVELPINSRLAARVEGKSSLARLGIGIHITAPTIHAGFAGQIQLEMINFGGHEIILDEGMKICQLIFEQTTGTPEKGYSGIFAQQRVGKS